MIIAHRKFSGESDKQRMSALVRQFPAGNLHIHDLPYRLSSWALDDPEYICLWVGDGQQIMAWAVLQTPFWAIDYACHPHPPENLHRRILTWADGRARGVLDPKRASHVVCECLCGSDRPYP